MSSVLHLLFWNDHRWGPNRQHRLGHQKNERRHDQVRITVVANLTVTPLTEDYYFWISTFLWKWLFLNDVKIQNPRRHHLVDHEGKRGLPYSSGIIESRTAVQHAGISRIGRTNNSTANDADLPRTHDSNNRGKDQSFVGWKFLPKFRFFKNGSIWMTHKIRKKIGSSSSYLLVWSATGYFYSKKWKLKIKIQIQSRLPSFLVPQSTSGVSKDGHRDGIRFGANAHHFQPLFTLC